MRSTISFILCLILLILTLTGCAHNTNNTTANNNETSNVQKLDTEVSITNTNAFQNTLTNEIRIGAHESELMNETELASFSTKLGGKATPRSRNIGITTSALNETIVKKGETFSFCNTIGKPTADKGYEEADSFDADGNTVKTLGGGNCQVSSTLYNVVLQIPDLKVTERHAHSKAVHYVAKDKDAAVSYGSVNIRIVKMQ